MRTLGIITNIDANSITIAISSSNQVSYLTYPKNNYPYQLLSTVEYTEDTITPILDNNFTKEEKQLLISIMSVLMTDPHLNTTFLEQLDVISPKPSRR